MALRPSLRLVLAEAGGALDLSCFAYLALPSRRNMRGEGPRALSLKGRRRGLQDLVLPHGRLRRRRRAGVAFGWIFAAHQLGAATAAFGAGLSKSMLASYVPAFFAAGAMCLVASAWRETPPMTGGSIPASVPRASTAVRSVRCAPPAQYSGCRRGSPPGAGYFSVFALRFGAPATTGGAKCRLETATR
jgi:hypothetical protein